MSNPNQDYRLPTDVTPVHYDLKIWTDLEALKFEGTVEVCLNVNKETSKIVLHTRDLELSDVTLRSDTDGSVQHASSIEHEPVQQRTTLSFTNAVSASSTAVLSITFTAPLVMGRMMGYYAGKTASGELLSVTQFQPTDARRAFPCWDEPALKATFAMALISRKDLVNLNNMPALSEDVCTPDMAGSDSWLSRKVASFTDPAEWKITRFGTTPAMSSYIVAFATGPFEHIESSYTSPVSGRVCPLRVYTARGGTKQGQYPLDYMAACMPEYESMFHIEYPLPKLDILAADDFIGGMENWGLIICRSQYVLYDSASNDIKQQQIVAQMVGHECAHLWFGDITTMEWWDNLYLNEGFATLVGEKAILDRLQPEWKPDAVFLISRFYDARALDAKLSSHPIEVDCSDANKVMQIFDSLSYSKAASVLRMLLSYVGENRFMQGVAIYMKKHKYGNTVTKDLWQGIQEATGLDIPVIMDGWVKEMGYPVITVTEQDDGLHIRQDRFLESGPASPEDNKTIWKVPISIVADGDGPLMVQRNFILEDREISIPFDTQKPFKLNADTTGFYVTNYSAERLVKLGQYAALPSTVFSLSDRMGLVGDAFALAQAGYANVSSALGLINTMLEEKEYHVWSMIATSLSTLASVWYEHTHVVELLNAFRRYLFVPLAKKLGIDNSPIDTPDDQQLRVKAVEQAAEAGDTWVVQELKTRFARYMETRDSTVIPADLTKIAYRIGVREGGKPEWDFMLDVAKQNMGDPTQGIAALSALGATRNRALAESTFGFAMRDVRRQDVRFCAQGLMAGDGTWRHLLAESVMAQFDEVLEKLGDTFDMKGIITLAFGSLSSDEDYDATSEFFKEKDTALYDLALKQALDSIRARSAWLKRSTSELVEWLEQRKCEV